MDRKHCMTLCTVYSTPLRAYFNILTTLIYLHEEHTHQKRIREGSSSGAFRTYMYRHFKILIIRPVFIICGFASLFAMQFRPVANQKAKLIRNVAIQKSLTSRNHKIINKQILHGFYVFYEWHHSINSLYQNKKTSVNGIEDMQTIHLLI